MDEQGGSATDTSVAVIDTGRVLDETTASPVLKRVQELSNSTVQCIIFDCQQLEYITSYGLSVFLRARKALREAHGEAAPLESFGDGHDAAGSSGAAQNPTSVVKTYTGSRIRLANVGETVLDVLRTAHLTSVLPIFDSVDAAMITDPV